MLQQCGCEHGSAVMSCQVTSPSVCGPNRASTPVCVSRSKRVDASGAPRPEHRLNRDAADERRVERIANDVADLVVVHTERRGHGERHEDAGGTQPRHGVFLDPAKIRAAMMLVRVETEAVELEIRLDARVVLLETRDATDRSSRLECRSC